MFSPLAKGIRGDFPKDLPASFLYLRGARHIGRFLANKTGRGCETPARRVSSMIGYFSSFRCPKKAITVKPVPSSSMVAGSGMGAGPGPRCLRRCSGDPTALPTADSLDQGCRVVINLWRSGEAHEIERFGTDRLQGVDAGQQVNGLIARGELASCKVEFDIEEAAASGWAQVGC